MTRPRMLYGYEVISEGLRGTCNHNHCILESICKTFLERKSFTTTTKESLNEVESDKNSRNEAMYDKDDTINELGKDLTSVPLNQRAKRQANEFVSNIILSTKRFLQA